MDGEELALERGDGDGGQRVGLGGGDGGGEEGGVTRGVEEGGGGERVDAEGVGKVGGEGVRGGHRGEMEGR